MTVRIAKISELLEAVTWLMAGKEANSFDLGILDYPTLEVVKSGDICYLPWHGGAILESVGFRPSATPREKLEATVSAVRAIEQKAAEMGIRELYFMSSDDRTDEAAAKHLGFEKVVMFRKKVQR